MSTTQGPEILTPENARQTRTPETATPVAAEESLNKIDQAEKVVANHIKKSKRQEIEPVERAHTAAAVDPLVKRGLREEADKAREVRDSLNKLKLIAPDLNTEALEVRKSVQVFVRAADEGLIIPPTHEPTLKVYRTLISIIKEKGDLSVKIAPYLHVLIDGILNEPEYIQFSLEGENPTKFERDLEQMLRSKTADYYLHDLFIRVFTDYGAAAIPNTSRDQVTTKLTAIKKHLESLPKEKDDRNDNEEGYLLKALEGDEDKEEGRSTMELYRALESPREFFNYYKAKYEEQLTIVSNPSNTNFIQNEDTRKERAAKDVTESIQKRIQFMMYKIYSEILNGSPRKAFNESVQDASSLYGANPSRIYSWLKRKVIRIKSDLERSTDNFQAQADAIKMPFFQFGNEEKDIFVTPKKDENDQVEKHQKKSRFIKETVVSSELKKTNFHEFVENLHVSMDAENDLLQAGINFNHLMLTGKLDQGQNSFFSQAAHYAEQFLPTPRLDELYKLPYHEVVESAKIALSSYYKKEFAKIGWKRNPELLQGIFESLDRVQKELLEDMVKNYSKSEPKVPEWAVKRAMIHARMHLSLVNLDMHALASYAHAPISDLGNTTYRDPVLKNLEVFKTWYAHEQWGVSDTSLKGMAFMPSPSKSIAHHHWDHEQVRKEGEEIYEQSLLMGKLSRVGRHYFDWDTAPNIMELNPMKFGGIEVQRGFRIKYPAMPWLTDLMDHLNNEEQLKLDKKTDVTEGWKRLENIGINVLKMYRDNFLFGAENDFIKFEGEGVKKEEHMKDFFSYLYERYFSEGVGKDALSMSFTDSDFQEKNIKFSSIANKEQFWTQIVEPILHRKIVRGPEETAKGAEIRNMAARASDLKQLVNHALTVMAFERMPMDFVFVEDPSRSQNGVTLISELQREFIDVNNDPNVSQKDRDEHNEHQIKALDHAFNDLVYVQQYAREESVKQMNEFIKSQNDAGIGGRNLFSKNAADINTKIRGDIDLTHGQGGKGYVIDAAVVRTVLEKRYAGEPGGQERINTALEVYRKIALKIIDKPTKSDYELNPDLAGGRFEQFQEARDKHMQTRLAWSGDELLSDETVFSINDTAYQFLEFVRSGEGMITRSIQAIANTQEAYKTWMTGGEGKLLSALKKYYRKDDVAALHEGIVEMRNSIKEEDEDQANRMAFEVLMNSINVMRINSEAEEKEVELGYIASHKKRSAFSVVVNEGEEYPLRAEERYSIVEEFLHSAQFPKRAKEGNQVYEYEAPKQTFQQFLGNLGETGEKLGNFVDGFFGLDTGKLVRKRWKEMSGEGLRSRELAGVWDILSHHGSELFQLLAIALLFILIKSGYEGSGDSHH